MAQDQGFFDKESLKLDIVLTGGSANSAQMTAAGAVNLGSSSWLDTIRAIDRGAPIVVVANSLAQATTMMLGGKSVKSVKDLKGARVSVGGAKDITMVWWQALAKQNGLDGQSDVEVVFGGGTPARFSALAAGAVQAAAVATPLAFKAIQEGYVNLGVLGPLLPTVPYMTWHANRSWAGSNPNAVTAFVRANNRAIDFIFDTSNRQKAAEILAKASQVAIDDALKTYDLVIEIKGFEKGSQFTDESVNGVLQQLAAWGDIAPAGKTPASYVDRRFLTAAQ